MVIYLIGQNGWAYDPIGQRTTCLGPINIQSPRALVQRIDPQAADGGWLTACDLAYAQRHHHLPTR
ncbi:MAG: hypothetical protein WDO13_06270 [Verrucomicrobiota bacterium]